MMFFQLYMIKNGNIVKWCFVLFFFKCLLYAYACVTLWWVKTFSYIYWEHGIYGLTEDFQILVGIFIFGGSSFFYTRFIIYEKLEEGVNTCTTKI